MRLTAPLTVPAVETYVENIRSIVGDDERAHPEEDALFTGWYSKPSPKTIRIVRS